MDSGLILHTSNRLENLADDLARILAEPLASPLTAEIVVVQSKGMRRWLTQQIAQRLGICSNVHFPFPHDFFRGRFEEAFPEAQQTNFFERDVMTWRILELLPRFAPQPQFASVAHYLNGRRAELRGYELARRIAHVFDQYVVFRPQMILGWDAGEGEEWQPILWRALQRDAPDQHQAALGARLAQALERGAPIPDRANIFGISTLPPFYVSLIEQVSVRCPVHLFLMEPTPHWFGDIRSKREKLRQPELNFASEEDNSLLAANARLSRDFLNIIADLSPRGFREQFIPPAADTLLHIIQRDIYEMHSAARPEKRDREDDSLQIHSCHSVVRELEVLHDQLLAQFEKHPALKPGDVVVMTPDVSVYAPFIDAVFGVPENPQHYIPFTVADRAPRASSGVIDTFFRVLEILPSRFGASEVLAILESPAAQRHFNMKPTDVTIIQRWVDECGICWGIDAPHRVKLGFPGFAENSWRHGLDRMLLGYAMQPEGRELFEGIWPFDEIEGSNAVLLGNLVEFLERLFARATDFSRARTLSAWQRDLVATIDDFLDPDEPVELNQLRAAVNSLGEISRSLQTDMAVSLEVVASQLENSLEQTSSGAGFLSGRMTFCALKPMRSIPFKIVCLLGLNDTAYPRRDHTPSFDLIAATRRRGDRSVRDDDRALFLEALLSARDVLYLSYIGQSMRDNSTLPPSVLIGELLDYIAGNYVGSSDDFVVRHPLQAFSPRNFQTDGRCFSYSADNCAASLMSEATRREVRPFFDQPLSEPEGDWREVEIAQLINFFAHSSRFLLRQRLGIDLPEEEQDIEDREPFALHSLDRYSIEQEFLGRALGGAGLQTELAAIRAAGVLPPGPEGTLVFEELCTNVHAFAGMIGAHVATELQPPLTIREQIGDFIVTGSINRVRGESLIHYRVTKLKAKDYLRVWIEHLARNLTEQKSAKLFGKEGEVVAGYELAPVENAREQLAELLALYWRGLCEPLPLFPRTSWTFVEMIGQGKSEDAARRAAEQVWKGNEDEGRGEREDSYIALAFRDVENPLDQQWEEISRRIFFPIIEACQPL